MAANIGDPIKVMLAVLFGVVICVAAVAVLATSGIGGSGTSAALTSTGSDLTTALPFIGLLVAGGFVMIAIGKR